MSQQLEWYENWDSTLLPNNLNYKRALSRPSITFEQHYLLPGANKQLVALKGKSDRGTQ